MSKISTFLFALLMLATTASIANRPADNAALLSPDLTVSIIAEDVNLQWDAFADAKEFIVEVATSVSATGDLQFETIGTVKANGSRRYAFTDKSNKTAGIRYYRVTQIMNHGGSLISDVQSANFLLKDFFTSNVYMNADFTALTIQINANLDGVAAVSMENPFGTKVFSDELATTKGFNHFDIAIPASVEDGMYLLTITCNNATQTVMLQKMSAGEFIVRN